MASPLTGQAQAALIRLYDQAKHTTDNFILERIDRALDEIIRLNSADPPAWQVRSALANASKVITARRQIVASWPTDGDETSDATAGRQEDVIELRSWLRSTPHVTEQQRRLLILLAEGHDAVDVAALLDIPILRAREQISRARRAARSAYATTGMAAA
jgi:DNA-directed RNA polymerase specialized sigma24 family protein